MRNVTLTTDGGCWPNPGPGAWAAILRYGQHVKTLCGAEPATTNNRMELTAIIEGLRAINEPCRVTVRTDSMVCIYAMRAASCDKGRKKKRKNPDLVKLLWREMDRHRIEPVWVKGHNGDEDNEWCDRKADSLRRTVATPNFP